MEKIIDSARKMAQYWYREWYHYKIAPHLTSQQKDALMHRISDMTLKDPIWDDKETNFIKQFPELKPYSSNGIISGLQLMSVMEAIFTELHPEAKLPDIAGLRVAYLHV